MDILACTVEQLMRMIISIDPEQATSWSSLVAGAVLMAFFLYRL